MPSLARCEVNPSPRRRFGVEVETSSSFGTMKKLIQDYLPPRTGRVLYRESNCESCSKGKWYLKVDGSTESEMTTPAITLSSPDYKVFRYILDHMRKNRVLITQNDGLHVHVDASDVDDGRLMVAWLLLERGVIGLFPKYRTMTSRSGWDGRLYSKRYILRNGGECSRRVVDYYEKAIAAARDDKYMAMSMRNYDKRGTIEFRLSEGTLDFNHVDCWVRTCLCLVDYASKFDLMTAVTMPMEDRPKLEKAMMIKQARLRRWLSARQEEFS